jgi:hypothetical protein
MSRRRVPYSNPGERKRGYKARGAEAEGGGDKEVKVNESNRIE